MLQFEQAWNSWHPNSFPVGYMMRAADEPNWIRFHSLPLSKRYADTDEERGTPIRRQNVLANEVLGVGCPVWLAQSCWVTPEGICDAVNEEEYFAPRHAHNLSWAFRFIDDQGDGEEHAWNVYAKLTTWQPDTFDNLLRAIATEETGRIVWMSVSTGSVFAPYDGGVDLFLQGAQQVREMSRKYPDWLPMHPSGM